VVIKVVFASKGHESRGVQKAAFIKDDVEHSYSQLIEGGGGT